MTDAQRAALDAARAWAEAEDRVRALLLKGSLGRGEGDVLSDLDLVIVCAPGARAELWESREAVAAELGEPHGVFEEAPWQAPFTAIALFPGPVKVDLFFQEGEARPDPWLADGFAAVVDKDRLAETLHARLAMVAEDDVPPDWLRELDVHAWDWMWWAHVKLERGGQEWLIYFELVKLAEFVVIGGRNALAGEPWRGASDAGARLSPELNGRIQAALPRAPASDELRRSLRALAALHVEAREDLGRAGMRRTDAFMAEVLPRL